MRIAIVVFNYSTKNMHLLPWRYIYEFSQQFQFLNNSVTIITDGSSEETQISGTPIIRLSHVKHFPPRNSRNIAKALSEIDPHVILWQMGFTNFFQKGLFEAVNYPIAALMCSSVYWRREIMNNLTFSEIVTERTLLSTNIAETFVPRILPRRTLNSKAIKFVISMSQENLRRLKKIGVNPEKLAYVSPGVDSKFFENSSSNETRRIRVANGVDYKDFLVLYLGPPLFTRGIDTLLKAVDWALDRFPDLQSRLRVLFLLRTRKGEYDFQLRKLMNFLSCIKHKQVVNVKLGFLSHSDIRSYMAASDFIVFPFKHVVSDFPVGVVEAMSVGKPVLATKVDGISELLEDNRGILVNPRDHVGMGRLIVHYSENRDILSGYGKRSRAYMLQRPTWRQSAEKLLELFQKVQ